MAVIRALAEADLAAAQRLVRVAFGTYLGAPDPERFWTDRDYVRGRFGAPHIAAFAAEEEGALVGSNFAIKWGSVGFFGPVSIRPDVQNRGIGQSLVAAACERFAAWGTRHAGLFTFAGSARHIHLYGKFGFHPRFLTAVLAAPAGPVGGMRPGSRYSALSESERGESLAAARELCDALYAGLDLGAEIRTVAARQLGDTVLSRDGGGRLAGFAICHWGPDSEAGAETCFVKFAAIRPGPGDGERFEALLDACAALACEIGMKRVEAGVNLAREEAYRRMLARGFRTQIQGVAMHRPNEPGYSRPGVYVLDDWR